MGTTLDGGVVQYGSYLCKLCGKDYTVNEPGTFDRCTADFCHACMRQAKKESDEYQEWLYEQGGIGVARDGTDI